MFGWQGKVLIVDLNLNSIRSEPLDPRVARDYVGGRGLGIYYLNKLANPNCDPLSADNPLIMTTGPLTGTSAPTGGRYMVTTKSPLTGGLACANSGGKFPNQFKRTGFDAIIITGKATAPVYLWVDNAKAVLKPAEHLWGMDVPETTDSLLKETDLKAKVACIGPAGERGVLFASIMNDKDRAAGRGGVGMVMGAKKLKAVVVKGKQKPAIADKEGFDRFHKQVMDKFREAAKTHPSPLSQHGTIGVMTPLTQKHGILPTRNYRDGIFDGWEAICGATLTKKYLKHTSACFGCPISCGRVTEVKEPLEFAGKGEGPEFESGFALGSMCMVDNLAAVTKANYVCNELGMDTITMGVTMACAMELDELGLLDHSKSNGPIKWGDGSRLVELTRMTGLMDGFGRDLAEGSFRLALKHGRPELAMVSKKLELPGYDPRGLQGQGLGYATSPLGASHCRSHMAYIEMVGIPVSVDRHQWQDKASLVSRWQDVFSIIDSAGICIFFAVRNLLQQDKWIAPVGLSEYLKTATGINYEPDDLLKVGERILNAERLFLVSAGFDRKDDILPSRLLKEPMDKGPSQGKVVHLVEMLDEYYKARGWTVMGIPTPEKLSELGLSRQVQ